MIEEAYKRFKEKKLRDTPQLPPPATPASEKPDKTEKQSDKVETATNKDDTKK
jgi:hypothetical protein